MPRRRSIPQLELVHSVRGRARLRLAGGRGDYEALEAIAYRIGDVDGVQAVDARPATASIVVHHHGDFAVIAATAARRRVFELTAARPPADGAPRRLRELDARKLATLGGVALFSGLGVWQLGRGELLPPALTLLLYAGRFAATLARGAPPDRWPAPPDPFD